MKKGIFIISIILNLILSMTIISSHYHKYTGYNNKNYTQHLALYKIYNTKKSDIVMLGDSITEGADWGKLSPGKDIFNMGIGGDTTEGILNRIDYVNALKPKRCFVMMGINDITNGLDLNIVKSNYVKILINLKSHDITPIVQSTLYMGAGKLSTQKVNSEVTDLNKFIKKYCEENNIKYLDVNKYLAPNGFLEKRYSPGVRHLNANAYKVWHNIIKNYY
jgi:lysophospholipase L1-like esterase